jgi:guanylate kinase
MCLFVLVLYSLASIIQGTIFLVAAALLINMHCGFFPNTPPETTAGDPWIIKVAASFTKKRVIICGKAASGKGLLKKQLRGRGYKVDVQVTTRPMRSGECEGVDYFFKNVRAFSALERKNTFREVQRFNGWSYGTLRESWDSYQVQVFVMAPPSIKEMTKDDRDASFIIYLDADEEARAKRLLARCDVYAAERRISSDKLDFEEFSEYDMRATGPLFSCQWACRVIKSAVPPALDTISFARYRYDS